MVFSLKLYILHRLKRNWFFTTFRYKNKFKKILKKLLSSPREKCIVRTLKGFNLAIDPVTDKGIESSIFENGIYEEGTLNAFESIIKKGDIVFDLGANIGLTSIYASMLTGKAGKVYSFEAHPGTFNILKYNIEINKCENIIPLNYAISDSSGIGMIYENLDVNRGAASLIKKNHFQKSFKIRTISIDQFTDKYKINRIDFIKMDIEGFELNAIKGMQNFLKVKSKPILCIELSFDVNTAETINELFLILTVELKYLAFKQEKSKTLGGNFVKINEFKDLPRFDNIYFFQSKHISNIKNY